MEVNKYWMNHTRYDVVGCSAKSNCSYMKDEISNKDEAANSDLGAVSGSAIPQELINRSIGISQCITEAVKNRLPTRIIRMYAEESKRIDAEFRHYR